MYKALSIILSPTTHLLACAVGKVAIFVVARFIVLRHGKAQFRSLVDSLSIKAHSVLQELAEKFVPTHLITNEDIQGFKSKYNSLQDEINTLKTHKYFDAEVFDDSECATLISSLSDIELRRNECNSIYSAIDELKSAATKIFAEYRAFTHPSHYFAHSELEDFIE